MNNRTNFVLFEQEMGYSRGPNGWDRFLQGDFIRRVDGISQEGYFGHVKEGQRFLL